MPGNGDVNPYGVAVIPRSTGHLWQGNVLVSNFNNKANVQGTGTTIVEVTPSGHVSLFAQINPHLPGCPGGVGLTTALTVLRSGWVIVGSLPTKNGNVSGSGCLIVLDRWGHVRETFAGQGINGPWDMGSLDLGSQAVLFVTNVLNGTVAAKGGTVFGGTVLRLVVQIPRFGLPWIQFNTTIGSGFPEQLNRRLWSSARPASASARTASCTWPTRWRTGWPAFPTRSSAASVPDAASPSPGGTT